MSAARLDNPFPAQATKVLPGDPQTIVEIETVASRNLPRAAMDRAFGFVADYIEHYDPARSGQFIALLGEHGSGKTHTINYLIGRAKTLTAPRDRARNPFHFTVTIENPDLGTFYRSVYAQIKEQPLRELMAVARDHVAIDQLKELSEVNDDKAEKLRGNRKAAERLYAGYLVDRSAVETLQVEEISRLPYGSEQFQRALPFLFGNDPVLATYAYQWLAGLDAGAAALRAIGASGTIDSPEMFKSGLQLLAALFRVARRPFLLYLDQFEKLIGVAELPDQPNAAGVGVLRRLIDEIPNGGGLVLLAGTPLAWDKMPTDFRQRFGQQVVELRSLDFNEAEDLVQLFLPKETGIRPFDPSGIETLLKFSRGNFRWFLQSCSSMYAFAGPTGKLDRTLVEAAIRKDGLKPPEEDREVFAAIERELTASGLSFIRSDHIYRQTVDYAVGPKGEPPRIVVETTRAVYKDDETQIARKLLDLAGDVRNVYGPNGIVVAVVLGYATREVSAVLGSAIRQVFYDRRTFADDFRAALKMPTPSSPVQAKPAPAESAADDLLSELRGEVARMQAQRDSEVETLQQQIRELMDRTTVEHALPVTNLADRWYDEKVRLQGAIHKTRAERRETEFQKVRRAALLMEREWRNLHLRLAVIMAIVFAALFAIRWILMSSDLNGTRAMFEWLTITLLVPIVAAGILALSFFRFLQSPVLRRLYHPIETFDELEQLHIDSPRAAASLLDHRHPEVRYVASRSIRPGQYSVQELMNALAFERLPLVREAQALALARDVLDHPGAMEYLSQWRIPEVVYVAERLDAAPRSNDDRLQIASLLGSGQLQQYFERYGNAGLLMRSFDDDDVGLEMAASTSRQRAKSALRELSPFDDGLGTFHALKVIDLIDELYLFWAEVAFVLERARPARLLSPERQGAGSSSDGIANGA